MGFKFLDSLALGAVGAPALGVIPIVGTGLAVYGVYKLVRIVISDKSTVNSKDDDFDYFDDKEEDEVQNDISGFDNLLGFGKVINAEKKVHEANTIGDVVKYVGWIFGGMLVKDVCTVVKSWGYSHVVKMFSKTRDNHVALWDSVNKSMGDIQKLAWCADDGKRLGMEKSVEFISSNLLRDGFYTWRRIG